ncbi:MAG: PIN domain-containing protein [Acidobacteriota bacterium]
MIVLIDTDVLLDVALDRPPYAAAAVELLNACQVGHLSGFVAWHSISNFYYLVRPTKGGLETRSMVLDLLQFIRVAATDTESLLYAIGLEMNDFEDAMQVAAAVACNAEVIVTRNHRDYTDSPITVSGPQALTSELDLRLPPST